MIAGWVSGYAVQKSGAMERSGKLERLEKDEHKKADSKKIGAVFCSCCVKIGY